MFGHFLFRVDISVNSSAHTVYEGISLCEAYIHHSDIIMSAMASQMTGVLIVCSTVCSGADQKKYQAPRHWPLWGESTGDRWIPFKKGQ